MVIRGQKAMRAEKTVEIDYSDESGKVSTRAIWPVALAYYEEKQIVAAWCTLRLGFRNFRVDRISAARAVEIRYGRSRAQLTKEWEAVWRTKRGS